MKRRSRQIEQAGTQGGEVCLRPSLFGGLVWSFLLAAILALVTAWMNRLTRYLDVVILWLYLQVPLAVASMMLGAIFGLGGRFISRFRRERTSRLAYSSVTFGALLAMSIGFMALAAVRSMWWYHDVYPWVESWAEMLVIVCAWMVAIGLLTVVSFITIVRVTRLAVGSLVGGRVWPLWAVAFLIVQSCFALVCSLSDHSSSSAERPAELPVRAPEFSRVVLVGVDGVDPKITRQLMAEDRLPNLARLASKGTSAELKSLNPTNSPVIWTSVSTGVSRRQHGVMNFLVQHPKGMEQPIRTFPSHLGLNTTFLLRKFFGSQRVDTYPVTASQRYAATVWEIAGFYGLTTAVVNWWPSWPASDQTGFMVTDHFDDYLAVASKEVSRRAAGGELGETSSPVPGPPARLTWPPELTEELLAYSRARKWTAIDDEQWMEIGLELWRRHRIDLLMIYLPGPDREQHLYWDAYQPELFRGDSGDYIDRHSMSIPSSYVRLDRVIGRLLAEVEEDTTVLVVSDHGAAPVFSFLSYHSYSGGHEHAPPGVLFGGGPGILPGSSASEASILDIAPTVLRLLGIPASRSMEGRVLDELLQPSFSHSLQPEPESWDFLAQTVQARQDSALTEEQEDALRALGYID